MKRRAGFTIVEMLMVVGVIAVLMGLVSTGAVSALRTARDRRADALAASIQMGIATYRAVEGTWPWGGIGTANESLRTLDESEYDKTMTELVKMTHNKKRPVVDLSALVAIDKSRAGKRRAYGMDFRDALKKSRKNGKINISNLTFGYSRKADGLFRRFKITLNVGTDSVKVEKNDNPPGLE